MTQAAFKLSDPGASLALDPATSEYLRCYEFPQPPSARYGFVRFESASDRVSLFGQAWVPSHAAGTVLVLHGYAEHGGNYAKLVSELVEARMAVAMMDMRGHGLSEGPRGHLDHANLYAEDAEQFLGQVFSQLLPSRPFHIWGHSLGSLVGLQLLRRGKLPVKPASAVFCSPLLGFPELQGKQKLLATLAPLVAAVLPTLPINHGISSTILSHDEEYLARRLEDPLMTWVTTPRWLLSAVKAVEDVQNHASDYQTMTPTLLMLAGDEKVTNLNLARKFAFHAYGTLRHKVIEFPGYYHEIEKEPAIRSRVVSESLAWLNLHQ